MAAITPVTSRERGRNLLHRETALRHRSRPAHRPIGHAPTLATETLIFRPTRSCNLQHVPVCFSSLLQLQSPAILLPGLQ